MKIQLTSLFEFDVLETFGHEEVNLEAERTTLKALLQELARESKGTVEFIDPQGSKFIGDFFVQVNGIEFDQLPQGLETELNDGDEVGIGWVDILYSGG
ncbi:MoaD/ThiS family protein [Chloroflexota bacterium]